MEPMEYGSVSRVIRTIFVVFISVVLSMGMLPAQSFAGEATAKTQGVSSSTTSSAATSVDTQSVSGGSEVTGSSVDNEGTNQNVTAHQTQANDTDETSSNGISSTSSPSAPPSTVQTGGDSTDAAAIESPIETKSGSSSASSSSTTASSSSSKSEEKEQEETVETQVPLYQEGATPESDEDDLSIQSSSFDYAKLQARIVDVLTSAPANPVIDISDMKIPYSEASDVVSCFQDTINSHPELFYVSGNVSYSYSWTGSLTTAKLVKLTATYSYAQSSIAGMKSSYNSALSKMLSWVPASASNANKAKAVHDYLVRNCKYNTTAANVGSSGYGDMSPWNAYGALVKAAPVCQGYSLAFMAGMQKLGIDCTYVTQTVGGSGHGWNRVKIDGAWFNVDVTFDDTTPDRGFSATPYTDYFMKSDSYWTSHTVSSWHANWSPRGVAGTSTKYDNASWPTYNSASGQPVSANSSTAQTGTGNATANTGVNNGASVSSTKAIYRLYNKVSKEHLYTFDSNEKNALSRLKDWDYEGVGWSAPSSGAPVYRVYNPRSGEHVYTKDKNESTTLVRACGWKDEGVCFYSGGTSGTGMHRLYNPAAGIGGHHYTANANEYKTLKSRGWKDEGVAWYTA